MTRRVIVLRTKTNGLWATHEFNGDKDEFAQFNSSDTCNMTWSEVLRLFDGVRTLAEFAKAYVFAQAAYVSSIAQDPPHTAYRIKKLSSICADEVYLIEFGKVGKLYPMEAAEPDYDAYIAEQEHQHAAELDERAEQGGYGMLMK